MTRILTNVCVSLVCLTAACVGKTVLQSPDDLIKSQDESAVIICAHNIPSHDRILWYKKDIMGFNFMGFLNLKYANPEPEFKDKIKMEGDAQKNGTLSINSLRVNDSAVYFCAPGGYNPAYFGSGTKLTVLEHTVSKKDDIHITVIKPSEKESCKKTVTLVCVASNFYPDHVTIQWMVGGSLRTDGVATDLYATKQDKDAKTFTISSRLKVTKKEWRSAKNEFKCQMLFYNGSDYLQLEDNVYGTEGSHYTREDYFNSSKVMKLAYGMFIAKSGLYGLVIFAFVWRKGSSGK